MKKMNVKFKKKYYLNTLNDDKIIKIVKQFQIRMIVHLKKVRLFYLMEINQYIENY